MSINVYWACIEKEWLRAETPTSVLSKLKDKRYLTDTGVIQCPAFTDTLKNIFCLRSIYDYTFEVAQDNVTSNNYDQLFFDQHVNIRSLHNKLFSFEQHFVFFTDAPSLKLTGNFQPFLELNDINERCIVIPGTFDIGKWFRNIEFAFYLKEPYSQFKISEGDIYTYLKFHTDEKINFIQYRHTEKLANILRENINVRNNTSHLKNLSVYYKMFKTKKIILKEIKENIL